ncbi:hypothetical protein IC229_10730 [Spirosoma sp. BT702]|uniref:Uncharacterized protein n=1 Tax=Spirosoma profusum TaxID=2771354 RepID=A0A927AQT7_9BACT|nr:hypothetical protein [Spirosoma profusum]MBD2701111.1 hypothetical protein [Spirosoma profusum]
MNQDNKSSNYEATPSEMEKMILEWATATDAFHARYAKLTRVIGSLQGATRRQSSANRAHLRKLMDLRQHMGDVLMTLFLDMGNQQSGRSALPSKPGQLRSHAILLREMSREIDAELITISTVAQA